MDLVPLQAVPSQIIAVTLGTQLCQLNVYQKSTGLFIDVYVAGQLILGGAICQDRNRIMRSSYLGLNGDLVFIDQEGTDDPFYTGIGSRYLLFFLNNNDLTQVEQFPPAVSQSAFTTAPSSAFLVDPDALAVANAFDARPSALYLQAMSNFVAGMKSIGAWSLFDVFYTPASQDQASALVNWKNPAAFRLVVHGGVSFTPFVGASGDGVSAFLDTTWNFSSSAINYQPNGAMIFARSLTASIRAGALVGEAGNNVRIYPNFTDGKAHWSVNGTVMSSVATASGTGLWIATASGTAQPLYLNGTLFSSGSAAGSLSVLNDTLLALSGQGTFFNGTIASFGAGGLLTPTQIAQFAALELTFMKAIGAVSS
jgi:hypothetical protein